MSHSQSHSEDEILVLPTHALLVAPTVERAASLGTAFDDAVVATPGEVSSILITQGNDLPCVVISGIPPRAGRLAAVVETVLKWCPRGVQILLDVGHPVGGDLRETSMEALRGLEFIDCHNLAGVPCLRFRPAEDPEAVPDVNSVVEVLEGAPDPRARPLTELDRLTTQIADLDRELNRATAKIATLSSELDKVRVERDSAIRTLERIRAHPIGLTLLGVFSKGGAVRAASVVVGVVVIGALCAVVGRTTDTGYVGGAVTVLLGLSVGHVLQAWSYDRRSRALARKYASSSKDAARRVRATEKPLAEIEATVARLERSIAVLTVSSVDTAASLAEMQQRLRQAANRGE